ncbi:MAG: PAS domain-containing protein, partial [Bacteroidota bacterium]
MSTKEIQIDGGQLQLLHSFPSPAAVVDEDGQLVITNKEWNNRSETNCFLQSVTSNGNLFECFREAAETGSDDALKVIIGLRRILDEETEYFETQYLNELDGERQWLNISIRVFKSRYAIFYVQEVTKHMQAFRELRDSRERYQQQFNYSLNGIIIGTPDGKVIDANPSACNILGYSKEELKRGGRNLIMDLKNSVNEEAHKKRDEQTFFEGEKLYVHKTGREIPVTVSSIMFRDKDGELSTINSFRDISKEKRIQKKLKNEQEFAQTTIASIPGIFYVLDTDGSFLQWNDAFIDQLGYSEEDMFGMKPVQLFHKDDKEEVSQKLNDVIRYGAAESVARVLTKEGEVRLFKLNARTFKNEDTTYIIGTGMDITELVDAKLSSERNFHLMDQLFENAPIGIVMIDKDDKISRVNDGFRKMFGYTNGDSDVVSKDVNELITNEETREMADRVSREAFKGKASQFESVRYTKDGDKVPVLVSTTPVSNGENIIAVYGIYVNLKEQKELEVQIKDLLSREREARQKAQDSLNEKEILL